MSRCSCNQCLFTILACLIASTIIIHRFFIAPNNAFSIPLASKTPVKVEGGQSSLNIPKIVHQMWKTGLTGRFGPPAETIRWRDGCKAVNSQYQFVMYSDVDLLNFTLEHYSQYSALFKSLKGVCKSC